MRPCGFSISHSGKFKSNVTGAISSAGSVHDLPSRSVDFPHGNSSG